MENRRKHTTEYKVRYSTDRNAALQPEYIPQHKPQTRTKNHAKHNSKAQYRAEVRKYAALTGVVVVAAAIVFCVVYRNALIFRNAQQINKLAKERVNIELQINSVESTSSEASELNSFFEIAQDKLDMVYPESNEIVQIVCPAATQNTAETVTNVNSYDDILDWINGLFRGNNSWA